MAEKWPTVDSSHCSQRAGRKYSKRLRLSSIGVSHSSAKGIREGCMRKRRTAGWVFAKARNTARSAGTTLSVG